MEIVCYDCQGIFGVNYRQIYMIEEDYYVAFCPACDAENEIWDIEDWYEPHQIRFIKRNSEDDDDDEGGCDEEYDW